jgi:hypothetical protein
MIRRLRGRRAIALIEGDNTVRTTLARERLAAEAATQIAALFVTSLGEAETPYGKDEGFEIDVVMMPWDEYRALTQQAENARRILSDMVRRMEP